MPTKRPLNICRSCRYTWYPRGRHVSASCPSCGGGLTDLAGAVAFEEAGVALGEVLRSFVRGIDAAGRLAASLLGWILPRAWRASRAAAGASGSCLERLRLSDWAQPIAWGLALVAPPVASILWWQGPRTPSGAALIASAFVASGAVLGWLLFDYRRSSAESAARSAHEAFRGELVHRLKTVAKSQFSFAALVEECRIDRDVADEIADALFSRMASRVMDDGVVTALERRRLDGFAIALEIDADRAASIEDEARTARYQEAYRRAIADGVITREEAFELNDLRASLGVEHETDYVEPSRLMATNPVRS